MLSRFLQTAAVSKDREEQASKLEQVTRNYESLEKEFKDCSHGKVGDASSIYTKVQGSAYSIVLRPHWFFFMDKW